MATIVVKIDSIKIISGVENILMNYELFADTVNITKRCVEQRRKRDFLKGSNSK